MEYVEKSRDCKLEEEGEENTPMGTVPGWRVM
jgi:hypothetical protein